MAERKKRRVLPGFGFSLGVSVTFVSLILLLPMSALVRELSHLTWAGYWEIITNPQTLAALRVTLLSAFWASALRVFCLPGCSRATASPDAGFSMR